MLNLRSLAFIFASAMRRARALSCAALHRSPDRISGSKIATKRDTKMAIKRRSLPCQAPAKSLHFVPFVHAWLGQATHLLSFPLNNFPRRDVTIVCGGSTLYLQEPSFSDAFPLPPVQLCPFWNEFTAIGHRVQVIDGIGVAGFRRESGLTKNASQRHASQMIRSSQ